MLPVGPFVRNKANSRRTGRKTHRPQGPQVLPPPGPSVRNKMRPTKVATAQNSRRYWPRNAARTPLARLLSQASNKANSGQAVVQTKPIRSRPPRIRGRSCKTNPISGGWPARPAGCTNKANFRLASYRPRPSKDPRRERMRWGTRKHLAASLRARGRDRLSLAGRSGAGTLCLAVTGLLQNGHWAYILGFPNAIGSRLGALPGNLILRLPGRMGVNSSLAMSYSLGRKT